MMRNGATLASAAMKSIPTRDGLKPSKIMIQKRALAAKANGGVTTET